MESGLGKPVSGLFGAARVDHFPIVCKGLIETSREFKHFVEGVLFRHADDQFPVQFQLLMFKLFETFLKRASQPPKVLAYC